MLLEIAFQLVQEAIRLGGDMPLPTPAVLPNGQLAPVPINDVKLEGLQGAYVESVERCDVFETDLLVSLRRNFEGGYDSALSLLGGEWTVESAN
jgi:hypothetical protein